MFLWVISGLSSWAGEVSAVWPQRGLGGLGLVPANAPPLPVGLPQMLQPYSQEGPPNLLIMCHPAKGLTGTPSLDGEGRPRAPKGSGTQLWPFP